MLTSAKRHRRILRAVISMQFVEANRTRFGERRIHDTDKPRDLLTAGVDPDNAAFDNHIHAHTAGQATMAGQENVIVLAAQGTIQQI